MGSGQGKRDRQLDRDLFLPRPPLHPWIQPPCHTHMLQAPCRWPREVCVFISLRHGSGLDGRRQLAELKSVDVN